MANIPQWKVGDVLSASKLNAMVDAINDLLAGQTGNNDVYVTLDELNDILKQYSDIGHTHSVNEIVDLVLPTKLSQLQNDTLYVTEDYVTNAIANAQLGGDGEVDLSAYATKNYVDSEIDKIELTPGPKGEQGPQGEKGEQGPQGEQGPAGADGKTPIKGVDYFTANDKTEMLNGYATETFVNNAIANAQLGGDEMVWKPLSYEFHEGYINSNNGVYWLTESAGCNSIKIDTTTLKKFKINILDVTGVNRFRIAFMRTRVDELQFSSSSVTATKPSNVIILDDNIPETYEIEVPTDMNSIYIQLTNSNITLNTDVELYYYTATNNSELYIDASNILNNNDAIGIYESNINFADSIAGVTTSDIYAVYSDLFSRFPDYVSEEILGKDSLNNDIKCYTFNKPYPQRQYIDDNVTNDIPYETDVRPKIIINSGTHGDEKGSALALSLFLKELCENDTNSSIRYIKNNIILKVIPILNPSGMDANTRNNVNNVNINRDFLNKSQLETQIMVNFIQNNLDSIAILDFHNTVGKPSFWNYPDDPTMLELSLSVLTNINDIWLKRNPLYKEYAPLGLIVDSNTGGGSLKDYAASLGILSTTVESARHSSAVSGVSSHYFNVEGMNMGVELLVNLILLILKRQPQAQVNGEGGNFATEDFVRDEIEKAQLNGGNIETDEVSKIIESMEQYMVPSIVLDSGTVASIRTQTSVFSGWAIPFRKSNIGDIITGFEAYMTAYDMQDKTKIINNVDVELWLVEYDEGTKKWVKTPTKQLASSVLVESGSCRFDFELETKDLPEIFGLLVCSRSTFLMLYNGEYNGEYKDTDIPCGYTINGAASGVSTSTSNHYIVTRFIIYGDKELKFDTSSQSVKTARFDLPDEINTVVGDTLELFVTGMVDALNPYNYQLYFKGSKGALYTRKYQYTAQTNDIGSFNIACSLIDEGDILQDSKMLKINVLDKPINPSSMKTVLFIGDSLTSGGEYPKEFLRRLTATDGNPVGNGLTNIQLCGTCSVDTNVNFEGYGGWKYEHYMSTSETTNQYWISVTTSMPSSYQKSVWQDANGKKWVLETLEDNRIKVYRNTAGSYLLPNSGQLTWVSGGDGSANSNITYSSVTSESGNPFWNNDTNKMDMTMYMQKIGVENIDYIYILLGWNELSSVEGVLENATLFLDMLHEQLPDTKITLCGLQPPNHDGCATNYGLDSGGFYGRPRIIRKHVAEYNKGLNELVKDRDYAFFLHLGCQYDVEYSSPKKVVPIHNRTEETMTIGSNGVHPGKIGYLQMADAIYRDFVYKLTL